MAKVASEKTAVVEDVREKAAETSTAVVTEYRGLTVAEISSLRRELRAAGAEYKVQKNTLVRRGIEGTPTEPLSEFLEGPTAIAWIRGDISAVAKVLRDFAKATPTLVIKGGVLDGRSLSAADLGALADLPSRDVLLAQLAGLMAAPLRQMAGLIKAVPQNFAYGLSALIDAKGGPQAAPAPEAEVTETPAGVEDSDGAEASAEAAAEEVVAEAPTADETTESADADAEPAE
jgi:large subunit ribosomal protein L10